MPIQVSSSRFVALLAGFVLASTTLVTSPAHAIDKEKKLKYGAIALGAIGAYMLSTGKTVPAAAAAAGGYYVYKKSEKARDEERYGYRNDDYRNDRDRYGYNPDRSDNGDIYPDGYSTQFRSNANVRGRKAVRNYDLSSYLR